MTKEVDIMLVLFKNFDADGDGRISYAEFLEGLRVDDDKELPRLGTKLRDAFAQHAQAEFYRQLFRKLDIDRSGHISSEEFLIAMAQLGIRNLDAEDAMRIFQQVSVRDLSLSPLRDWGRGPGAWGSPNSRL